MVAALLSAVSILASVVGPNMVATNPILHWTGVYPGNTGAPGVAKFERYLGAPVSHVTVFLDDNDWKFVDRAQDFGLATFENHPYQLIVSVPMIPVDSGNTIEQGAAGQLNYHYRDLARDLVGLGMGHAIIRLGWELSGNWFPWSSMSDPVAFADYWRQAVTTMRSVAGGHFLFDWNGININGGRYDPSVSYPGDRYVDFITTDVYDWAPGYYHHNDPSPATVRDWWARVAFGGPYSLQWMANFARRHGKPMGLPEWGLMTRPDGQGGGDDVTFLRLMSGWIKTHNVAYADYFDYNLSNGNASALVDSAFPQATKLYPQLFG